MVCVIPFGFTSLSTYFQSGFFFVCFGAGDQTQGLAHAKKMLRPSPKFRNLDGTLACFFCHMLHP
jgi:hypothetical protein